MSSSLVGVLAIAYGAVFALFGYPIFRILLPIYGGMIGYIVGVTVVAPDYPIAALVVAVILAILFASAAYLYWSVMIGIAGAILGYGLVTVLFGALWPSATYMSLLVGLAGALAGSYAFIYAKDVNGHGGQRAQWRNDRGMGISCLALSRFTDLGLLHNHCICPRGSYRSCGATEIFRSATEICPKSHK